MCIVVLCFFLFYVRVRICFLFFFFLMIRRPPRSTLDRSSAASDVYKRQFTGCKLFIGKPFVVSITNVFCNLFNGFPSVRMVAVSYTHLRAHETVLDLVCRLLLEKKKQNNTYCLINKQNI